MTLDERRMLNELLNDDSDRLSEWEMGFLESLDELRDVLSDRQADKLEAVWKKVFG